MGRLLLQRPALMAAPVLQRAVTAALEVLPQDRAVRQLGSLVARFGREVRFRSMAKNRPSSWGPKLI